MCFSEVRLGLMPDWGGGACLARLVGSAHATDLILTARVVKADEAAAKLIASGECIHGITAFMGKKAPRFPD